jgi:hypothetical protein
MTGTRVARAFFGATSLVVTFGLVLQLWLSVTGGTDDGALALDRRLPAVRVG